MQPSNLLILSWATLVLATAGCTAKARVTNGNNNFNNNTNTDGGPGSVVYFEGRVWSPGADSPTVLEHNRFPIPGAAVIAHFDPPDDLPQQMYCNECIDIPNHLPHAIGDEVDGSFTLALAPGTTYYLAVQKGEFRRVRELTTPDTPGDTFTFETGQEGPRPEITTLPNRNELANGDNIPKIAMIDAAYEDQEPMFRALEFDWDNDIDVYSSSGPNTITDLTDDWTRLTQYNLVVVPCGEDWPMTAAARQNIKQFVKEGGKLYVDDWNYDWVEQVWPEFLTFWNEGPCADGADPPPSAGECNIGPSYDFHGDPGPEYFRDWLALTEVNRGDPLVMELAYDFIHQMHEGEVGIDPETGTGPNGEVYLLPFVWMYNSDTTEAGTGLPATVSWPYYCGKVLFTVYHTEPYNDTGMLLLQEKIMMYLIMEIQTCSSGPVVR